LLNGIAPRIQIFQQTFKFLNHPSSSPMSNAQIPMKRRMHGKFLRENNVEIRIARALPDFALPARFKKADVIICRRLRAKSSAKFRPKT